MRLISEEALMKNYACPRVLCISLGLLWLALVCPAQPPMPPKAPREEPIPELIKQLGSDVPEEREKATEQLMWRPDAAALLRKALTSPDAEIVRRAKLILGTLAQSEEDLALRRLKQLGTNGEADQVVEWLVRQPKGKDKDVTWQVVSDLATKLIAIDRPTFLKGQLIPESPRSYDDFARFRETYRLDFTTGDSVSTPNRSGRFIIRAHKVHLGGGVGGGVIIATGGITDNRDFVADTVVLANESIELESVGHSVIVCDGDVTVRSVVQHSVIVARGKVVFSDPVIAVIRESLIATASTFHAPAGVRDLKTCTIREKADEPLFDLIRFFDPARAGISVVSLRDRLEVKTVTKDKPFARAGVRTGDVVLAVDGTAVTSPESFRKLLRRAVATQPEVSLKLRREDEALSVKVPLRE